MKLVHRGIALLALLPVMAAGQSARSLPALGAMLEPGMQLVYASDGVESPPWTIDSVVTGLTFATHSGCIRIRLRTMPAQPPETRIHCLRDDTMLNGDERTGRVRPARPLTPGMSMLVEQPNAGGVQFETAQPAVERIPVHRPDGVSQIAVDVLPTTVTTFDSTGAVVRRLRERFSVALGTATGGIFEVPDSGQAGGWRVVRRFELVAIKRP